ncbi:aminotransferase class V-fold PLP-dependent enzyme [Thermosyntropha sp.]|uniref:aminotransferase class V-fold PLP-dependent enzyme n=1 Tax=Thermosyntropha sp. TaxID=2740820 RepID=UPI0025F62139|nr:aminotransferase class V-fold PLP-dependent enzyme [Thermosyntropha sp.]MBO8159625.1 aminotransferase class V-fold PLP-dependent enzyme [Thermosyntropha sp.]
MPYFDNAATTFPKPEAVYAFMDAFYRQYGVNVGRGQYRLADEAAKLVEETREMLLSLFNCSQLGEAVFMPSATIALNLILHGIICQKGINVYVSPFEHNAVMRVLYHLQKIYSINIEILKVDRASMCYDLESIHNQMTEKKPDVVIISHASNVCGLIAPVEEIFSFSKKMGAVNVLDMAQTAGLLSIDLSRIEADFAVFAGHKTLYAPFGAAGFIVKNSIKLPPPFFYGGTGVDSANLDMPDTVPERYEAGSLNITAIAGLNAALKWINDVGLDNIRLKESENFKKLKGLLQKYGNIDIIGLGNIENHVGIISCVFKEYSSDEIGRILSKFDIAVRTGLHCAPKAHQFLGTYPAGTMRFSVGYFNCEEDFSALDEALEYIYDNY